MHIKTLKSNGQYRDWATGWITKESLFFSGRGKRFFPSPKLTDQPWGPPSLIQWVVEFLSQVKWPGYKSDHSI
jgi:hypothetical protein